MSDGDVFTLLLTGRFDLPHRSGPRSEEMANIKIQTPTHDARFDKTKPTGNQHQYPDFCSSGLTKMTLREPHVDSFVAVLVPSATSNWCDRSHCQADMSVYEQIIALKNQWE
jgi:hypothetical protein